MSQQAFVTQRVGLPPSSFSGDQFTYLQRVALALNNIPRHSFTSFAAGPNSNVTGKAGDTLVNIASLATAERFWFKNTGSGNTGWVSLATAGGGGGGAGLVNSVSGTAPITALPTTGAVVVGVTAGNLLGTTNQITVSGGTAALLAGNATLSLPQNIHTSATVQFGSLGLNAVAGATVGTITAILGANNVTGYTLKRFTDTAPTGNFEDFQNALGVSLWKIDITGAAVAGSIGGSFGSINIGTNTITSGAITASGNFTLSKTTPVVRLIDSSASGVSGILVGRDNGASDLWSIGRESINVFDGTQLGIATYDTASIQLATNNVVRLTLSTSTITSTLPLTLGSNSLTAGAGTFSSDVTLSAGRIIETAAANNTTLLQLKRFTDTAPTGTFADFQNALGVSLWKIDITGAAVAGSIGGSFGSINIGSNSLTAGVGTFTAANFPLILHGSNNSSGIQFIGDATPAIYNWLIASNFNYGNTLEFTPSTATGGTTFSSSAMRLTQAGALTLAAGLTATTIAGTGDATVTSGNIKAMTAGKGFFVKEGANAKMGTGTLSGGTVTISTTAVSATSRIFLTDTGGSNIGSLSVGTITAGTSFVVNSTNALDASTFNWVILDPA